MAYGENAPSCDPLSKQASKQVVYFISMPCLMLPEPCRVMQKDLSQFQRKSAHAPQKELPKRKLEWKFMKITEMIISVFIYIK